MKKIKIIVIILIVFVVLLAVGLLAVATHLGDIVKAGMERVGPKITQTTLTVDAVKISLLAGSAGINGFALGNPEGYQSPQSISISNAAVSLVPGSIMADKVIIRSVVVQSAEITFEGNPLGANNLTKIMASVNAMAGSGANPDATPGTNAPAAAPAGEKKPAKKLEVDEFVITGARVHAKLTGIVNQEVTLTLPDIRLADLGKGPDGITAADLTQTVLSKITAETVQALANSASDLGKNAVNSAKTALQGAANGAVQNASSNTVNKLKQGLGGLLGQ